MSNADTTRSTRAIAPVSLSFDIDCPIDHAFRVFTENTGAWWPLESHAVESDKRNTCVLEAYEGGRFYEVTTDGAEHRWGTVLECEPPHRLAFTWHPGREPDMSTRVTLRFESIGDASRLHLVHEGFEVYGEQADAVRENYHTGWQLVAGERFVRNAEDKKS